MKNSNSLFNEAYQVDESKLGKILGGQATTTGGGSKTVGAGTSNETTFDYSSDTVDGNHTTYHQCENGGDVACEQDPAVAANP